MQISNATTVHVRAPGNPKKWRAKVLCDGKVCDLALLTVITSPSGSAATIMHHLLRMRQGVSTSPGHQCKCFWRGSHARRRSCRRSSRIFKRSSRAIACWQVEDEAFWTDDMQSLTFVSTPELQDEILVAGCAVTGKS